MNIPGSPVLVRVVDSPSRKLLLKRAARATDYFGYCQEVGCDIWETLLGVKEALQEPMGLWLPDSLRPSGASLYAQGVEVPADYAGPAPAGLELLDLPPCKMMLFQGPPYDDERCAEAVKAVKDAIDGYDPTPSGHVWADGDAPRFQFAPQGARGYIEGRPVRPL